MEPYKIVFMIAVLIAAYATPDIAYSFVLKKCKRTNRRIPEKKKSFSWNIVCAVIGVVSAAVSFYRMNDLSAAFCIVFSLFAVFGVTVDSYIRIIANEMLLAMLPVGLAYRIVTGGVKSLLGSLFALVIVIAVFGLAMLATKKLKGAVGVGMGDVKLAMVIAITVGWPEVLVFLGGMAIAILVYCVVGLVTRVLQKGSYFPMAGMLLAGFMLSLFAPFWAIPH